MDGKNKLTIIIEVSDTLAKPEALTKIKQLDLIHHLDVSNKVDGYIAHFLFKEYNVTSKDIERLADFILEKIKDDFEKVFDTLVAHCYVNGNLLEIKDKLVKEATK
jgi:ribosomal protein S17E